MKSIISFAWFHLFISFKGHEAMIYSLKSGNEESKNKIHVTPKFILGIVELMDRFIAQCPYKLNAEVKFIISA